MYELTLSYTTISGIQSQQPATIPYLEIILVGVTPLTDKKKIIIGRPLSFYNVTKRNKKKRKKKENGPMTLILLTGLNYRSACP